MRLMVVTEDGEVVKTIDLDDYDLSKPFAQAELIEEIESA